jgi:hypothetical protein
MIAALLAIALSHESGVSSSLLEARPDEVRVTFTFSLEDVASLARLDADRDGIVDPEEWTRVLPAIFAYLGDHFRIDGCRSEGDFGRVPGRLRATDLRTPVTLAVRYVPSRPLDHLGIRCDLFREHGGNPRHVSEIADGGTTVFDCARSEIKLPLSRPPLPAAALACAAAAAMLLLFVAVGLGF